MHTYGTQQIRSGSLFIGGCRAADLADQFETPLYLIDEEFFRRNCREYLAASRAAYPKSEVAYASKALCNIAISRIAFEEGLWIDVASVGELTTALAAGYGTAETHGKREREIFFHGNNKQPKDIAAGLEVPGLTFVVDWLGEIETLNDMAGASGVTPDVLIRLAPGVDPDTHQAIRTGQADTKFGFGIAGGAAEEAVRAVMASPNLHLCGYHAHVGSQLLDPEANIESVVELGRFSTLIQQKTGYSPDIVNVGGGLGIRYLDPDRPPEYDEFNKAIGGAMRDSFPNEPLLIQEPGRALVGETGITLYRIGAVKPVQLPDGRTRTYVSVDGGLSDNPRPQLYGATYDACIIDRADQRGETWCRLAGAHCETDTLIPEIMLPDPKPGDVLAVFCTGAYNYSMASNYNRFSRPAMILVNDGQAGVISKRETIEEVVSRDRLPAWFGKAT